MSEFDNNDYTKEYEDSNEESERYSDEVVEETVEDTDPNYSYSYTDNEDNTSNDSNDFKYSGKVHSKKVKNKQPLTGIKKVIVYALVFGLVAGFIMIGMIKAGTSIFGSSKTTAKLSTTKTTTSTKSNSDVAEVAANCIPSIVSITNMSVQEVQSFYGWFYGGGSGQTYESTSVGSGIIVSQTDDQILIATNNHVVADASTLSVTFYGDDENAVEATLVGTDSDKDLAVISVNIKDIPDDTFSNIKVATLGDSDSVQVGEQAIAIGNALGYGTSVTEGIISATNRQINTTSSDDSGSYFSQESSEDTNVNGTFLQTDAAINPGNSGGALLNSQGEVIGINSAKIVSESAEGVGYAIPISEAEPIIEGLINGTTGDVDATKGREVVDEDERGYLGISCKEIDSSTANSYGMPQGIYIAKTVSKQAAAKAGLQKGDVITKVEGQKVSTVDELKTLLSYYKAGEKVKVTYSRMDSSGNYKEDTVSVKLTKSTE